MDLSSVHRPYASTRCLPKLVSPVAVGIVRYCLGRCQQLPRALVLRRAEAQAGSVKSKRTTAADAIDDFLRSSVACFACAARSCVVLRTPFEPCPTYAASLTTSFACSYVPIFEPSANSALSEDDLRVRKSKSSAMVREVDEDGDGQVSNVALVCLFLFTLDSFSSKGLPCGTGSSSDDANANVLLATCAVDGMQWPPPLVHMQHEAHFACRFHAKSSATS